MDRQTPFFRTGGTMDPGAPSYIERSADAQLLEALLAGEYVFLLDSRQKGKSSLVARTIVKLKEAGVATVKLDLQRIGANVTPEQWYAGMLSGIGQELGIVKELFNYWESRLALGPLARWIGALEDIVLKWVRPSVVIFVDEIDFVRALPFPTDEFFAAIRDCFNRRSEETGFERLTFCLVGVATPGQLIRNPEITPFNIGTRIDLSDFTLGETSGYGVVLDTPERKGVQLMARVHYWLNGHPYLTQLLCSQIAADPGVRSSGDVDRLVQSLFLTPEVRQREPNFADVERRLLDPDVPDLPIEERRTRVLELYGQLLRGKRVEAKEENPVVATLRLSGVGLEDKRALQVRNRLYRVVFDERWRRQAMPDAELRRLRGAARVAILRTAAVAGVVVFGVSSAAVAMWRISGDKERALTTLGKQSGDLKRTSDERERALTELQRKNTELGRVSGERQLALSRLEQKNDELVRVSGERERVITDLRLRTDELTLSTYVGEMSAASAALAKGQWMKVSTLIEESKNNENRNWEWGHLALAVAFGTREESFPKWSNLEVLPGEAPKVFTPQGVYDFSQTPAKLLRSFRPGPAFVPDYRIGPFRVKRIDSNRGDAIFDHRTDRMLVKNRRYAGVFDIDPKRRLFLLARDETLDTIELRTIDGDRLIREYVGPTMADGARFLPDGSILCKLQADEKHGAELRHWDPSGAVLDTAPSEKEFSRDLTLSRDGTRYAVWGADPKVEVRWVKGHKSIGPELIHPQDVRDLVFSSDGGKVLTGCGDGVVRLFELKSGKLLQSFVGHRFGIYSVAFLDSGQGWASIDSRGNLRVWKAAPKPAVEVFSDQRNRVTGAQMAADQKTLVSRSTAFEFVSRNLETGKIVKAVPKRPREIARYAREEGVTDVYLGRNDGTVERMDGLTLQTASTSRPFDVKLGHLTVLPGGRRVLAGTEDKRFALLDGKSLAVIKRIEPKPVRKPVDSTGVPIEDNFCFDPTGTRFAVFLGAVGKIQVFDSGTGDLVNEWSPGRAVRSMVFAERCKQLVVSLGAEWYVRDGQTLVYDVATGRKAYEFIHPGRTMRFLTYAPATNILAGQTGDIDFSDRVVILWDMRTKKQIAELSTDPDVVYVSFSPDGKRAMTQTSDFAIGLWDSQTGDHLFDFKDTGYARFSADGRRIVQVTLADGKARVFNSAPWK